MICNWIKNKMVNLAKEGGFKFLTAVKKFIQDSRLINEIDDRADKELFLAAASSRKYRYIEDIKEDNIYDKFVELCFSQQTLGVDIKGFVEEYYSNKSKNAKEYIVDFFSQLSLIIFDVLKENATPDTKIILRGQEIAVAVILDKLSSLEQQIVVSNHTKDPTTIVTYCANMQNARWEIKDYEAAIPDKEVVRSISLSLSNSTITQQNGQGYWELERSSLVSNFMKKVSPLLEEGGSFSVFGLAPIPLLVLYGNQFANRPNVEVYQLKKTPSTWAWEEKGADLHIKTIFHNELTSAAEAIILLSFSGKVNLDNVRKILDVNVMTVVEIYIDEPYEDFLRTKGQLDEFLTEFRKLKSGLTNAGVKTIHLFAAIPMAFAIAIGQSYNPNYDAQLITYDYKQGNYTKALIIGETE